MKKLIQVSLAFLLLLTSFSAHARLSRADSVKAIQQFIRTNNMLSSQLAGKSINPSTNWMAGVMLANLATTNELLKATKDSSATLRLQAFVALQNRGYNTKKLQASFLKDHTPVTVMSGCVVNFSTVAEALPLLQEWYAPDTVNDFKQDWLKNKTNQKRFLQILLEQESS